MLIWWKIGKYFMYKIKTILSNLFFIFLCRVQFCKNVFGEVLCEVGEIVFKWCKLLTGMKFWVGLKVSRKMGNQSEMTIVLDDCQYRPKSVICASERTSVPYQEKPTKNPEMTEVQKATLNSVSIFLREQTTTTHSLRA